MKDQLCSLNRVSVGATVCIKELSAPAEVCAKLRALGFCEKQNVTLLSRGAGIVCEVCDAQLNLDEELAGAVMVEQPATPKSAWQIFLRTLFIAGALIIIGVLVWQGITAHGNPNPTAPHKSPTAAVMDIAVLVFREGLEAILVLAAIIASMTGEKRLHRKPIVIGGFAAFGATLVTWFVAVGIISNLQGNVSALNLQAATGLLAIIVLLVVMNWFFHKVYWGGWIAMHNRNKKKLLGSELSSRRLKWGLMLLGFASLYREGFEVVLFLQTYFLQMGGRTVLFGALLGLFFTGIVAVLTFVAHKKLPYRKMLIVTGIMLGFVLLVMVGEQAFEMQQAGWIGTTPIRWLEDKIPAWAGVWFSVFPTVQTLVAQAIAAVLVVGSYFAARLKTAGLREEEEIAISKV